ncbi:hypothetical protein ACJJTC_004462 [Scirpophaga incertulas]
MVDCIDNEEEFRVRVKELNSVKKLFMSVQLKIEKLLAKSGEFQKKTQLAIREELDIHYYKIQIILDRSKDIQRRQSIANTSGAQNTTHTHIKLPRRFELSLKSSNEIPNVQELLDFLSKELSAIEVMSPVHSGRAPGTARDPPRCAPLAYSAPPRREPASFAPPHATTERARHVDTTASSSNSPVADNNKYSYTPVHDFSTQSIQPSSVSFQHDVNSSSKCISLEEEPKQASLITEFSSSTLSCKDSNFITDKNYTVLLSTALVNLRAMNSVSLSHSPRPTFWPSMRPGYRLRHVPRTPDVHLRGGGVGFSATPHYARLLKDPPSESVEQMWLSVTLNGFKLAVGTACRLPWLCMDTFLEALTDHIVLVADLNINKYVETYRFEYTKNAEIYSMYES